MLCGGWRLLVNAQNCFECHISNNNNSNFENILLPKNIHNEANSENEIEAAGTIPAKSGKYNNVMLVVSHNVQWSAATMTFYIPNEKKECTLGVKNVFSKWHDHGVCTMRQFVACSPKTCWPRCLWLAIRSGQTVLGNDTVTSEHHVQLFLFPTLFLASIPYFVFAPNIPFADASHFFRIVIASLCFSC